MIIATLTVCFLLAFLPLVISAFALRYAANVFSKSIFGLSAVSFLLGLAQTGLLVGLSYRLFESEQMKQANLALQYVSIAGGSIMILAGGLWVGYFRLLMKSRPAKTPEPVPVERPPVGVEPAAFEPATVQPAAAQPAGDETSVPQPATRRRREKPEPERDWFSDEVPGARAFKPAATPPKSAPVRRPSARTGGAKPKTQRGL